MDVMSLLLLLSLAVTGWFWFDSLRALEVARRAGKRICDEENVQFLDDTVARIALALGARRLWSPGVAPHLSV